MENEWSNKAIVRGVCELGNHKQLYYRTLIIYILCCTSCALSGKFIPRLEFLNVCLDRPNKEMKDEAGGGLVLQELFGIGFTWPFICNREGCILRLDHPSPECGD